MSEINKENKNQNINLDDFDHEDDLWNSQAEENEANLPELELPLSEDDLALDNLSHVPKQEDDIILTVESQEVREGNDELTVDLEKAKDNQEKLVVLSDEIDTETEDIVDTLAESNVTNTPINQEIYEGEKVEVIETKSKRQINGNLDDLINEINRLTKVKNQLLRQQEEISNNICLLVKEGLQELEAKKQNLEITIKKLEKRKERINQEIKTSFVGISQDLAIRVQGFKDYLVGSLQDLAVAAEQLDLSPPQMQTWENPSPPVMINQESSKNANPQFVEKSFKEESRQIRRLLAQYRTKPDYYGSPWQLRRTFEPIHAERVADWFFTQGGRGALSSMGSRLQNILVASAIISILYQLYGDRTRVLILADTPEKLGEWRRGLQDCLGISRSDFGPNRGVVLFETAEALIQKGDRILGEDDLPFVIMDLNDDKVSLSLLKFPLWLAFAPERVVQSQDYY